MSPLLLRCYCWQLPLCRPPAARAVAGPQCGAAAPQPCAAPARPQRMPRCARRRMAAACPTPRAASRAERSSATTPMRASGSQRQRTGFPSVGGEVILLRMKRSDVLQETVGFYMARGYQVRRLPEPARRPGTGLLAPARGKRQCAPPSAASRARPCLPRNNRTLAGPFCMGT